MVRIVIDQSYTTHLQTGVLSHTDHYCSSQVHQWYRTNYIQPQDCVLIEDDGFDRIVTKIARYTSEPSNVSQFKSIINREIALWQMDHNINTQIMTFLISETLVNHELVSSPWWHIWQIQCQVQLILLKSKILPKHIISECKRWTLQLIPKSLYTIEYLNQSTKWSNYALVYVYDYMVKCIVIDNGQYKEIKYLNRWLKELKQLMEDMNVWQYYHHKQYDNMNSLTQWLVVKSINQYAHILGQWLGNYIKRGTSIALINQMSDHMMIQEQCTKYLSEYYDFYIIECSSILPRMGKRGDVDWQLYLSQQYQQ